MPGLHECQSAWSTADTKPTKADKPEIADADKGKDGSPADVAPDSGPTSPDVTVDDDTEDDDVSGRHVPRRPRGRPRKQ